MKLRTKLILGFGLGLFIMMVFAVSEFIMLSSFKSNMNLIVNEKYAGVKHAVAIRGELNEITRVIGNALLDESGEQFPEHVKSVTDSSERINAEWEQLLSLSSQTDNVPLMMKLSEEYTDFSRAVGALGSLLEQGNRSEAIAYYYSEVEPAREVLFEALKEFNSLYESEMEQTLDASMDIYRGTMQFSGVMIAILLLVAIVISVWVSLSVTRQLKRISRHMRQVSLLDDVIPRIPAGPDDEIGAIVRAFNDMAAKLEHHTMKEKEYQQSLEERAAHQAKIAEFSELLQGVQDLEPLAQQFLNEAAPLLGAGYAACYVRISSEQDKPLLQRAAVYGSEASGEPFDGADRPAEGLVVQCVLENRPIRLQSVPAGYIRIRSGLGNAEPSQLLIMPVPYEDQAIAVLEFAAFEPISPAAYAILEHSIVNLGVALHGAMAYQQVQQLLEETRTIAEELQTQSEELQLQQEELRTLNEQQEEEVKQTERRNRELEALRLELEEKHRELILQSRYKTEFLANMSHELRTPLNSLLLLAQQLYENKDKNLKPKQVDYLKTILSSGYDLLHLINDVLDLSKIESGKAQVVCDTIAARDIGAIASEQFQPQAAQKGIDFRVVFEDMTGEEKIHSDIQKLLQILRNLLSNAIKFTEAGSVTLTFRRSSRQGQDVLILAVSDTGIGIPEDKHGMIFETFRQADGTTSRKYGGTGLGLSISKELAALLGGDITLDSEVGKGSTFVLTIPMHLTPEMLPSGSAALEAAPSSEDFVLDKNAQVAVEADEGEGVSMSQLSGSKILLVDDDMRNIFALTGVLEDYGMEVVFAENGIECLDVLEQHADLDLVLMDMMMPKLDGYETIRRIRHGSSIHREIPIIALTAKAMKYDREKCIEAGANDYISKPIQIEQLLSLLQVWLHPQEREGQ